MNPGIVQVLDKSCSREIQDLLFHVTTSLSRQVEKTRPFSPSIYTRDLEAGGRSTGA